MEQDREASQSQALPSDSSLQAAAVAIQILHRSPIDQHSLLQTDTSKLTNRSTQLVQHRCNGRSCDSFMHWKPVQSNKHQRSEQAITTHQVSASNGGSAKNNA